MARPVIPRDTSLSEQHALNAIAYGVAAARSTDTFVNDAQGTTLALSVTNASKAIPANARAVSFWCATAFRWRLNVIADTSTGAYAAANDIITIAIDPTDTTPVTTLQAVLPSGTDTLYINWVFGT